MGQHGAIVAFAGRSILTQPGGAVTLRVPGRVRADILLAALTHLDRPVLVRYLGQTIVAACPDEVATGASVWDALRRPSRHTGVHPMAGGWMGLLADRLAGTVELLPGSPPDEAGPPPGAIARYPAVFVITDDGTATLHAETRGEQFEALRRAVDAPPTPGSVPGGGQSPGGVSRRDKSVLSSLPGDLYLAAVDRARDLIRAGDVYQVNLVQRLDAEWVHGPLALARAMWDAAGDAPHRAFVTLPEGTVISASPERMVASDGHVAWSEPIKGTAAPGKHAELTRSVKDRAEHVMIVDLVRNDLGRVARPGGVSVPLLMGPLSTSYADHMVSHVRAELRDDVGPADVLRAVFPAGSVTGAPKVRALEVIREIEPVGRGPAFGSVVAVGTDGSLDASVTIRTAWLPTGVPHAQYWSGGAIVWDSDPTAERDEAWRKARPFLDALGTEAP
jgi:anthranilate/para-aminobenzoate synthase component I